MSTRKLMLGLSGLLLAFAVAPGWADSQARIVRLSLVNGSVQIDRATGQGFEKAIANLPVTQGMKLRTDGDSRAEVEFENGATLRLASGAAVEFPDLSLRSDGGRVSTVRVDSGTVYMNVRHKKEDDFRVHVAGRELVLDHSVHFRLKVTSDEAQIAVFKGELAINGPQQARIKKNETLTVSLRDQDRNELAKGISPDASDTWDSNRIEYQDYYTARNYAGSPYNYGRSDLNYYGNWSYVPGYGNVWQPLGVGYGWDPFANGYWAWYPGFGYTFVSGYPWGWTPYRYGSWLYLGGYGWCWRPGGWNAWRTLPPVVNPPAAFVSPTAPTVVPGAGTPATIIVNRGPGRQKLPDPDRIGNVGPGSRTVPTTGVAAPVVRTAPANTVTAVPRAATPSPATNTRGAHMVPGPDGPVMRPPRMRDPDVGFRGGRSQEGRTEMGRSHRGAASAPAAAPAPRAAAPASAPAARTASPAPARAPSSGASKSPPK